MTIFSNELMLNFINLLQLPMICKPSPSHMAGRYVDGKVGYFPYIKTDTSLFYLNEGNVIKSKYDKKIVFFFTCAKGRRLV